MQAECCSCPTDTNNSRLNQEPLGAQANILRTFLEVANQTPQKELGFKVRVWEGENGG